MSNSPDKPTSQDSPGNATEPERAASPADTASVSGLPSYMGGGPTPDNGAPDALPLTESAPGRVEPLAQGHVPSAPASLTLGEAVKAAGSVITVAPDGAARIPPEGLEGDAPEAHDQATPRRPVEAGEDMPDATTSAPPPVSAAQTVSTSSPASGPGGRQDKTAADSPGKGFPGQPAGNGKSPGKPAPKATRPSGPSFGKSHPVLGVEQSMPHSMSSRLYTVFALFPLLWLTLAVILQSLFSLNARDLWTGEEALNAALFRNLLTQGTGLIPTLGGELFLDKPPLYFWFLRGLHELLRTDGPMLHLAAAALSCLLYLWAVLGLGRCVGRLDGRSNLASGIILLSTGTVMALTHYASDGLLFAALATASLIPLYRSFVSPGNSPTGMVIGFALAGAASLVHGPLGLAIPVVALLLFALWRGSAAQTRCVLISVLALFFGLCPALYGLPLLQAFGLQTDDAALSMQWGLMLLALPALLLIALASFAPKLRLCAGLSLLLMLAAFALTGSTPYFNWPLAYALPCLLAALFLLWQLTPQRLFRLDFFIGLAAGIAVIAAWPALLYLESGNLNLLTDVLPERLLPAPALAGLGLEGGWPGILSVLPLLLLPWLLTVLFLPWSGFLGKSMREGLAASRRPEKEGLAFLWCALLAVILLVSCLKDQSVRAYLPALGPLAALGGRAVLGLYGRRASGFRLGMAALLLLAGVATIVYGLVLFGILPQPGFIGLPEWRMASHGGFFITGAILLVTGALIWFGLGSSRPEGVLLLMLLAATGLGYPLGSLVAPHFDDLLSPKAQALTLKAYADNGYKTAVYNVPLGTYDFYAGSAAKQQDDAPPEGLSGLGPNAAAAMPLADYEAMPDKPEGFSVAQRQWIGCREYVLLASPVIENLPPAAVPYEPAPDIIHELLKLAGMEGREAPPAPQTPATTPQAPQPAPGDETAPAEPAPVTDGETDAAPEDTAPVGQAPAELSPAEQAPAEQNPVEAPSPLTPAEENPVTALPEGAGDAESAPAEGAAPSVDPASAVPSRDAAPSREDAGQEDVPGLAQDAGPEDAPVPAQNDSRESREDAAPGHAIPEEPLVPEPSGVENGTEHNGDEASE